MEMKPGYKYTEVGEIPTDWLVQRLADVVAFLDGTRRPVKDADRAKMRGDIPYYGASGIVDYVNDYLFDDDLILLGEDGENILSRNTRLAFRVSGKSWVNNHAHVLKPNKDTSIGYLSDYLESLNYEQFNSGTAQPKLNKKTCARIPIAVPPTKTEQDAIANALGDTESLVASITRLLFKKRQIKQGAMQELWSAKRRLPGFSQAWPSVTLKEIAPLQRGFDLPKRSRKQGSVPIVTSSGIEDAHNEAKVKGPGVVTGRYGTIGSVFFVEQDFWPLNTTLYVRDFRGNDPKFISYLLRTVDFETHSGKSGVPGVNRNDLHQLMVSLPPVGEQVAITKVLSNMDAEIAGLQDTLTKVTDLKRGMMRELLTGRIRLV